MQDHQLKRGLLWESGIFAGILAIIGAMAFAISLFADDYEKSGKDLEAKVNAIAASTSALNNKYDKVRRNKALFNSIMQLQSENRLDISQQIVKNRFDHLRDEYFLSNLHLSMSPITKLKDPAYQRTNYEVISSNVSLDFELLSDEYAYELINALEQDLPGSSKITSLTLTRQSDITNDILRTISQTGAAPLVKGEVKFTWLGIKPMETTDNANAQKKP